MEAQIQHGLLYSGGSGLSGRLTGAVYGRQLLAKPLVKARRGGKQTLENDDSEFSYNSPQNLAHWNRTAILCMGVGSV